MLSLPTKLKIPLKVPRMNRVYNGLATAFLHFSHKISGSPFGHFLACLN